MTRIPKKESELATLAEEMMAGLKNNASKFPAPPVTPEEMETEIGNYILNRDNVLAAKAAYEAAIENKKKAFETIDRSVKDNAYYCKKIAGKNEALLTMVGLSLTKRKEEEAPGQCRLFKVVKQGEGWASFQWKRPDKGGSVRAYKIERRNTTGDIWEIATVAMETKIEAQNQTIGEAFEYRVVATNKIGDGMPSNTVMVKL